MITSYICLKLELNRRIYAPVSRVYLERKSGFNRIVSGQRSFIFLPSYTHCLRVRIDFYIIQTIVKLWRRETGNDTTAVLLGVSDRNLCEWHDPETSKPLITSDRTQHDFAVHVARMSWKVFDVT